LKPIQLLDTFLPITENWLFDLFISINFPDVYGTKRTNGNLFPYKNLRISPSNMPSVFGKIQKNIHYYYTLNKEIGSSKEKLIVHSHFGNKGYKDSLFLKLSKKKFKHVISFYGYDASILLNSTKWVSRFRKLSNSVDKFLVLGPNMKNKLIDIGIDESKIEIFHLGVVVDRLNYKPIIPNKDKKIKFVISSSFNRKKGIPDAIKAYNQVFKTFKNIELDIIGDIPTQSEEYLNIKKEIMNLVNKCESKETINFCGFLPYEELTEKIEEAHFLLHPSITEANGNQEGTPITILNSMAMGTLVLSTNHSDIPEIIDNQKDGVLVDEQDYNALAEEIIKVINDTKKYETIVINGRKKIERDFNIRIQGEKLISIYESLF